VSHRTVSDVLLRLALQWSTRQKAYKINRVTLIAPALPAEVSWNFVDSGTAQALFGSFLVADPALAAEAIGGHR